MAFVKREYPSSFNIDEDIYESFDNTSMRNQQSGNTQNEAIVENGIQPPNSFADDSAMVENLTNRHSAGSSGNLNKDREPLEDRMFCLPFQIKTEEDEEVDWSRRDNPDINAQIGRNIPTPSQNASPQMLNAYNNQFVYQNLQSSPSYQQMFPLDLYERHQQVFANSFLNAYSHANSSNMPNMPYFRPHNLSEQPNLLQKDLSQIEAINTANRKRDIDSQFIKNLSSQSADLNGRLEGNATLPNHDTLFDATNKLRKEADNGDLIPKEEILPLRYNHAKSKFLNGIVSSLQQPTTSQLSSNDYYSNPDDTNGIVGNNVLESKKITDADLAFLTNDSDRNKHSQHCVKGEIVANDGEIAGKGKFLCDDCPYSCQSSAILKIHERTHSGVKPFSCSFCHYKSGQKNNVAKHILVHMKEKPFRCQYCDYKCAQKNNLVVHERTHTGEKPFICTFCEYKTVQKPNLVKHMYLHTNEKPYSCDVCEYRCVQKTNLMKHKQKHSTEKPFECSECDYKSTQKANLNKHQILHMKNKPFQCEICAFQCAQKCNLAKHRLSKHGLNSFHEMTAKSPEKIEPFNLPEPLNVSYINSNIHTNLNSNLNVNVSAINGTLSGNMNGNVDSGSMNGNINSPVNGSIHGNVNSPVSGNMLGNVNSPVSGNMHGNVNSPVSGNMHGNVNSPVSGNMLGNVNSPVSGNIHGNVSSPVSGNMHDNIINAVGENMRGNVNSAVRGIMNGNISSGVSGSMRGNIGTAVSENMHGNISSAVSSGNMNGIINSNVSGVINGNIGSVNINSTGNIINGIERTPAEDNDLSVVKL